MPRKPSPALLLALALEHLLLLDSFLLQNWWYEYNQFLLSEMEPYLTLSIFPECRYSGLNSPLV